MSSHFPDEQLHGEYATAEQREKRLGDIEVWLSCYAQLSEKLFAQPISYMDGAARFINSLYWETLESKVRPALLRAADARITIDRHKIASLTELCICYYQPILLDDESEKSEQNARLAFYVAQNIIGNWNAENIRTLFVSESFNREHLTWLRYLNYVSDFPIFSNAATWYLFERYCQLKSQQS